MSWRKGEEYLAAAAYTNQEEVALNLVEYTIHVENVVQYIIEKHQGNVQLFFVEYTQMRLGVFSQSLWNIILGCPVRE